jgi:NAD+ synthase (glutamine-hydrolysing)
MKVTLAQINPQPGNLDANCRMITEIIKSSAAAGSDLVVFPELSVTGYPPLDLLTYSRFIDDTAAAVQKIALECTGTAAIIGAPSPNTKKRGKPLLNSAILMQNGRIDTIFNKALLPTYDVFDEYRYFEPSSSFQTAIVNGMKIAVTICEDMWDDQPFLHGKEHRSIYAISPMEEIKKLEPELIINISASPFAHNRIETRETVFCTKAKKYQIPVVMVNQTGANSDLIFDGGSLIIDRAGEIVARLPLFRESVTTYDLKKTITTGAKIPPLPGKMELIYDALTLGISDYIKKTGQKRVVIGLSGGIDSAVVAALAAQAIGSENVTGILMPSRYSSAHSVTDAEELASNLGIQRITIGIELPVAGFEKILEPVFTGTRPDVTEENIQARIRALILMAYANKFSAIVLNTSNKSEAATGYGTLYGDMAGALSVLGDLYKTEVYELAAYINRERTLIPQSSITKAPSAELKPDQHDTDSLPPYDTLDKILFRYVDLQQDRETIISAGFDEETVKRVIRLIDLSEYKRFQAPPALRVSAKAFGNGRRIPLVSAHRI